MTRGGIPQILRMTLLLPEIVHKILTDELDFRWVFGKAFSKLLGGAGKDVYVENNGTELRGWTCEGIPGGLDCPLFLSNHIAAMFLKIKHEFFEIVKRIDFLFQHHFSFNINFFFINEQNVSSIVIKRSYVLLISKNFAYFHLSSLALDAKIKYNN